MIGRSEFPSSEKSKHDVFELIENSYPTDATVDFEDIQSHIAASREGDQFEFMVASAKSAECIGITTEGTVRDGFGFTITFNLDGQEYSFISDDKGDRIDPAPEEEL